MQTAIQVRRWIWLRRLARRHPVAFLLGAAILLLMRSALASTPSAVPGEPTCREIPGASATQYATGVACPPEGFARTIGYEPVLARTPAGWRYVRPVSADGGCSGPLPDVGPFWDFTGACRAHDYGYDLVRFGEGSRAGADDLLYRDMKRSCLANSALGRSMCATLADSTHAVLWVGEVSPGFEPGLAPEV